MRASQEDKYNCRKCPARQRAVRRCPKLTQAMIDADRTGVASIVKARPPDPEHPEACPKLKITGLSTGLIDDYMGIYSKSGKTLYATMAETPAKWYRAMQIIDNEVSLIKSEAYKSSSSPPSGLNKGTRRPPIVRRPPLKR